MTRALEARERLAQQDSHFRSMLEKHRQYDQRLRELRTRKFLTADEQMEEVRLKKLKLSLKDRMEALVRKFSEAS